MIVLYRKKNFKQAKDEIMKINSHVRMPELLAPAGTFEHLRAAVNAGADAVYVGGKKWGARANAGNFDDEEMKKAADYCHIRNVKLYVTMNTLVFDDEMAEALSYAGFLYEIGIDALIIQDLGLAMNIRKILPDFHIHLSTQGSVYSIEGVKAASELGFTRIVLAREVSVSDMKAIHEACGTELEVFVHGALCFCYSGQCQLSRFRGGRSGNRGMCAQPCRLPYKTDFSKHRYPLSPKDLCGIDSLGDLVDAGVASLKIEGRMKSPEYVAVVVSIYRKYLDMYAELGYYQVEEDDRRRLRQIFNRGGFTQGYYYGNPGEKLMSGSIPKHQGIKIGSVVKRGKRDLVEVKIDKGETLRLGDGIEIRNEEMPGNVVTYIKDLFEKDKLLIGDIRGNVRSGDEIYKITDKTLMEEAELYYALDKEGNERTVRKQAAAMKFTAHLREKAELTVYDAENCTVVYSDEAAEPALNKALTAVRIKEQLAKTGGSTFDVTDIDCIIDDGISMPMSQINKLRRDGLEKLASLKLENGRRNRSAAAINFENIPDVIDSENRETSAKCIYIYAYRADERTADEIKSAINDICDNANKDEPAESLEIKILIPIKAFMEHKDEVMRSSELEYRDASSGKLYRINAVPYISNISMGNEDSYVRNAFAEIVDCVKETGCEIVCGNIGWFKAFLASGVKTAAGYGMNSANVSTAALLKKLGAAYVIPSLEVIDTASYDGGALPLMITEHMMPETVLKNSNASYCTITDEYGDKSMLCMLGKYKSIYILK